MSDRLRASRFLFLSIFTIMALANFSTLAADVRTLSGPRTALVNIAANAPASVANTTNVSGGETNTANDSGSVTVSVAAACVTDPVVINANDSGAGSLRQAVLDACIGSTITFGTKVTGTITLLSEIAIGKDLTITGPGKRLTISGNDTNRLFAINNFSGLPFVAISFLEVTRGRTSGFGGAIFNNGGHLTVRNSTVSASTAVGGGGGLYNNVGTLIMINSTVSGNSTGSASGGGIYNSTSGTLTLRNVTVSTNTGLGGGILNFGNASLGVTIVAGNSTFSGAQDCSGTFSSIGYNLIGNNSGSNFIAGNPNADADIVGIPTSPINPRLSPLGFNGGPTRTHALLLGSPAIDKGSNILALPTDQRGNFVARTVNDPAIAPAPGGDNTDIGAFERISPTSSASISGRLLTSDGRGLRGAYVYLVGPGGTQAAISSTFGHYRFSGLTSGVTYTLSVRSKLYTFTPETATPYDDVPAFDLIAEPEFSLRR